MVVNNIEVGKMKELLLQLYTRSKKNEITARGAQLSYFFLLSVFPFLIFLITLIENIPLTQQATLDQLSLLLPEAAITVVEQIIREVDAADNVTLKSLGFFSALWLASRGTFALIKSINRAYNLKENRSFLKLIATEVFATLAIMLIVLCTLGLLVFGRFLGELVFQYIGLEDIFSVLWTILRYVVLLLIVFISFMLFFLYSPNCRLRLKDVYPGAIFSTLGWFFASQLFAIYINNFGSFFITYGSIGGIIVFMIWFYISSLTLLLGGEINALIYHTFQE